MTAQPRPTSALHTWLPMKPLPPSTTILLQGGGAVAVLRDISASILDDEDGERLVGGFVRIGSGSTGGFGAIPVKSHHLKIARAILSFSLLRSDP